MSKKKLQIEVKDSATTKKLRVQIKKIGTLAIPMLDDLHYGLDYIAAKKYVKSVKDASNLVHDVNLYVDTVTSKGVNTWMKKVDGIDLSTVIDNMRDLGANEKRVAAIEAVNMFAYDSGYRDSDGLLVQLFNSIREDEADAALKAQDAKDKAIANAKKAKEAAAKKSKRKPKKKATPKTEPTVTNGVHPSVYAEGMTEEQFDDAPDA